MSGANVSPTGRNRQVMTRREKTLLAAGLLIGGLVVAFVLVGRQYVISHQEPTAAAAETTVEDRKSTLLNSSH